MPGIRYHFALPTSLAAFLSISISHCYAVGVGLQASSSSSSHVVKVAADAHENASANSDEAAPLQGGQGIDASFGSTTAPPGVKSPLQSLAVSDWSDVKKVLQGFAPTECGMRYWPGSNAYLRVPNDAEAPPDVWQEAALPLLYPKRERYGSDEAGNAENRMQQTAAKIRDEVLECHRSFVQGERCRGLGGARGTRRLGGLRHIHAVKVLRELWRATIAEDHELHNKYNDHFPAIVNAVANLASLSPIEATDNEAERSRLRKVRLAALDLLLGEIRNHPESRKTGTSLFVTVCLDVREVLNVLLEPHCLRWNPTPCAVNMSGRTSPEEAKKKLERKAALQEEAKGLLRMIADRKDFDKFDRGYAADAIKKIEEQEKKLQKAGRSAA